MSVGQDCVCVDDLCAAARRRIPRTVFDFVAGGAGLDGGVRENTAAFDRIRLVPRALVDIRDIDLSRTLFGRTWALPFGVAPIGFANLVWPNADELLARAAIDADVPYCLSTAGTTSLERIAGVAGDHAWFQLYIFKTERLVDDLIDRAEAAGFDVLAMTVDVPVLSRRLRDMRNRFTLPLRPSLRLAVELATRPAWTIGTARAGPPRLANIERYLPAGTSAQALAAFFAAENCGVMDWSVLERIRRRWPRRLIVKGLLAPDDAVRARDAGADGIVVSNHGGRQLEGALAPITALPAIRAAAGPDFPVLLDSGIRSGEHVVKALAAGASFVLVGRVAMYGVAAGGADGIRAAIDILRDEIRVAAAHLGVRSMAELSPAYLHGLP